MMFNLLRSDLYRTVRMPMFWVYIVIVIAMCLVVVGAVSFLASPEFAQTVNESIEETQASDMSDAEKTAQIDDLQDDLNEIAPLDEKELPSLSYAWANFFLGSGFLGILGSCFIGIYLVRDVRSGFIKNLPLDKRSRRAYFTEKLIYTALIQAFFMALCLGLGTLSFSLFGISFAQEESAGFLALWIVLAWVVLTAYAFVIACISWVARSEWIPAFGSVFISSGILGTVLIQLSDLFVGAFPALKALPYWTLAGATAALDVGEQDFFGLASTYPIPQIGPEGQILLVAGIIIVAATVFAMAVCRRRNIK